MIRMVVAHTGRSEAIEEHGEPQGGEAGDGGDCCTSSFGNPLREKALERFQIWK